MTEPGIMLRGCGAKQSTPQSWQFGVGAATLDASVSTHLYVNALNAVQRHSVAGEADLEQR